MAEATVEEIAGYISGNVKRKQILDVLDKNGTKTFEDLRKITRTPKIILEKVLKSMVDNGVIIKQEDSFTLTENGKKAAKIVPKQSNTANAHKFESHVQRDI